MSNLSGEDLRQIEAHRAKDRPTPWAHLALRYGVNELDLRKVFDPKNDNLPAALAPVTPDEVRQSRDQRFLAMWKANTTRLDIMAVLGISASTIDHTRARLGLERRNPGRKVDNWTAEESEYVRRHFVVGGVSAAKVGQHLGRTRAAVIGFSSRQGWTRHIPKARPA